VIRATDLLGCVVHTDSGDKLGRVYDLRLREQPGEGWHLVGILIGGRGMLARLGATSEDGPTVPGTLIPWESIVELEPGSITVRRDAAAT
jgi:sporulation protein YlmC with PRC-barrel domain